MKKDRALLIIDVQKAFNDSKWGIRNNPNAEIKMKTVLEACRKQNWWIIHIQHISQDSSSVFYKESAGVAFKKIVLPMKEEKVIQKTVNSAFIGTELEPFLKIKKIKTIAIMGLTTPHCVSTTARMSGNLGYKTYLLSDATAAFGLYDEHEQFIEAETIHRISLATIHDEFATVIDSKSFLQSVLDSNTTN